MIDSVSSPGCSTTFPKRVWRSGIFEFCLGHSSRPSRNRLPGHDFCFVARRGNSIQRSKSHRFCHASPGGDQGKPEDSASRVLQNSSSLRFRLTIQDSPWQSDQRPPANDGTGRAGCFAAEGPGMRSMVQLAKQPMRTTEPMYILRRDPSSVKFGHLREVVTESERAEIGSLVFCTFARFQGRPQVAVQLTASLSWTAAGRTNGPRANSLPLEA